MPVAVVYTSVYLGDRTGYHYSVTGLLSSTGNSVAAVPDCTPDPVVGNHGEYVSGAAKCGVKGGALATIAKDKTKVGPYTGPC